ncbi:MAG TPA: type IV toxin-antitoxin system AbiEi family antitoxin domain-containing protein [Anaerovoracaceae bacterium]|nr:type IV toxin-antitoxin system AbiEi family antitoxin domain-containing protein [Anaerovoracaceae bacterium]
MIIEIMKKEFKRRGGVLKTAELRELGLSSRQIKRFVDDGVITRIKRGFYELTDYVVQEKIIIARLFTQAVIFLESALFYYGYTDRIPLAWQIAVNRYSKTTQYDIDYPPIEPYYLEPKLLEIGVDIMEIDGVKVRIYNKDRTICDVLRYENKLEKEVFNNAITRYTKDPEKNIRRLFEYADIFNIKNKVQLYVGMWL